MRFLLQVQSEKQNLHTLWAFRCLLVLLYRTLCGSVWSIITLRDFTLKRHRAIRAHLYPLLQKGNLLESVIPTLNRYIFKCSKDKGCIWLDTGFIFLALQGIDPCHTHTQKKNISTPQPWPVFGAQWSSGLSPPAQHQTLPVGVSWPADPFVAPRHQLICSL